MSQGVQLQHALKKTSVDKLPPHNLECELCLLGGCLLCNDNIIEALHYFSPEDFYKESHQIIFQAMKDLFEHGQEFDLLILIDYLRQQQNLQKAGTESYLVAIEDSYTFTSTQVSAHAKRIHEYAQRRRLLEFGYNLAQQCYLEQTTNEDLQKLISTSFETLFVEVSHQQATTIDLTVCPQPDQVLIELDGSPVVSQGNMMGIVSAIGYGKSHFCEFVAAKWVNPTCEPESKMTMCSPNGTCLYIDTERTITDCTYGLNRIYARTQASQHLEMLNEEKTAFKRLIFKSFITIDTPQQKLSELLYIIRKTPHLRLLVLDGILDFAEDFNSIPEAVRLCSMLFALANQHQFGIIYTIHSNRNDQSGKGKGHIGDIFQRKSTSFLRLHRDVHNPDLRILSTDFENRKVRSGSDRIATAFQWDSQDHMFHEVPYTQLDQKIQDLYMVFADILSDKDQVSYKELVSIYAKYTSKAKATTKRHIKQAVDQGMILKEKAYYKLNSEFLIS
jgi:hypothetical protein